MHRFDINAQAFIELTDEQVAEFRKYTERGIPLATVIAAEPSLWWDQFTANAHVMADEVAP